MSHDRWTNRQLRVGFTLFEVLLTISIMAIVAMMVVPSLRDDSRLRLLAASSIVQSDLEMAQVLTITQPDQAVVVRFDTVAQRYWLAFADTPETPITRPDTNEPYDITFGIGRASSCAGVSMHLVDVPSDTLTFNAQGGLENFTLRPIITLSLAGRQVLLNVAPTTGRITETVSE